MRHRLKLPIDLESLNHYLEPRVFWPGALAVAIVAIGALLSAGLERAEIASNNLLKPPAAAVTFQGDARTRSNFSLPASRAMSFRALEPSAALWLNAPAELQLADPQAKEPQFLKFEQGVQLVSDNLFQYLGGSFLWGRPFNYGEAMARKRYAIVSEGFLIRHLNTATLRPTEIFLNGLSFQIIGIWRSPSDQIEESSSVWVPISTASAFGDDERTLVTRFILPDSSSDSLNRAKSAVDRFQLNRGTSFNRPEFTWIDIGATPRNSLIWKQRLMPLNLASWVLVLALLVISGFAWDKLLARNWRTLATRQLWSKSPGRGLGTIAIPLCLRYWMGCASGLVLAIACTKLFEGAARIELRLSPGLILSPQMLALILGIPAFSCYLIQKRLKQPIPWFKLLR